MQSGAQMGVTAGPAFWAFAVPEPVTYRQIARDAGAAQWTFVAAEPTVQAGALMGVNAGVAAWVFALPEPAVTHMSALGVSAGAAVWAFTTAQPGIAQGFVVDAFGVDWTFDVPHITPGISVSPRRWRGHVALQSAADHARGGSGGVRRSPPRRRLFPRFLVGAELHLDLLWEPPLDDGGGVILRYQARLRDEAGQTLGWESAGDGAARSHRFRGLREGGRYRAVLRAWNVAGPSDPSEEAGGRAVRHARTG